MAFLRQMRGTTAGQKESEWNEEEKLICVFAPLFLAPLALRLALNGSELFINK